MRSVVAAIAALACLACTAPPPEAQTWIEIQSPHFRVTSQASVERTVPLVRQLEQFRQAVLDYTGVRPVAGVRPRVFVFGDYDSYAPFEYRLWVDGYYLSDMEGGFVVINAEATDGRTADLANHELVHFLVRGGSTGRVPLWYNEGFAEVLSTARVEGDAMVFGEPPAHALEALRPAWVDVATVSLPELVREGDLRGWYGPARRAFYAHAWALVHMLRLGHLDDGGGPDRNAALDRYLDLVARGRPALPAIEEAFGVSPEELGRELDAYIFRGRFPRAQVPAPALAEQATPAPQVVAPQEVLVRLAELATSLGGDHAERAREYLERAVALAPDAPRAQAWLAFHESSDRSPAEVLERFDRAVALGPGDPVVHTLLGRYELALSRGAGAVDDLPARNHWADRARGRFLRSIELDADPAAPHFYRGVASLVDGRHLRAAVRSLERARRRAPWSARIALRLGQVHARRGRIEAARRELETVAAWPDEEGHAEGARKLLKRLESLTPPGPDP